MESRVTAATFAAVLLALPGCLAPATAPDSSSAVTETITGISEESGLFDPLGYVSWKRHPCDRASVGPSGNYRLLESFFDPPELQLARMRHIIEGLPLDAAWIEHPDNWTWVSAKGKYRLDVSMPLQAPAEQGIEAIRATGASVAYGIQYHGNDTWSPDDVDRLQRQVLAAWNVDVVQSGPPERISHWGANLASVVQPEPFGGLVKALAMFGRGPSGNETISFLELHAFNAIVAEGSLLPSDEVTTIATRTAECMVQSLGYDPASLAWDHRGRPDLAARASSLAHWHSFTATQGPGRDCIDLHLYVDAATGAILEASSVVGKEEQRAYGVSCPFGPYD